MHKSSLLFLGVIPLTSLLSIAGTRAYYKGQFPQIYQAIQKAKDDYEAQIAELKEQHKTALEKLKNVQLGTETQKAELRRELNRKYNDTVAQLQAELQKYKADAEKVVARISNLKEQIQPAAPAPAQ